MLWLAEFGHENLAYVDLHCTSGKLIFKITPDNLLVAVNWFPLDATPVAVPVYLR